MDILKPELVWIENRCYRKLPIKGEDKKTYIEEELYPSQPNEYRDDEEREAESDNLPIQHENNKFWISIPVPGPLIGLVKGKQSRTVKNIEESTDAQIRFPNLPNNYGRDSRRPKSDPTTYAVITSTKRHSVAEAYRRIERIIQSGRWKVADYTHFISIPMNNAKIQKGFLSFQDDVLTNYKSVRGINKDLFVKASTLHLTVIMLTLFDDRDKELAKASLNKCKTEIIEMIDKKSLRIEVKGLEYMNDDPAEVDVLYGKVRETDEDNLLQMIAEKLAEAFIGINLAKKEYDNVKLHVTLMKSRGEGEMRNSFDARPLLQKYSDYVFGEMDISEIHISTRYTAAKEKYYIPTAIITL